MKEVPVFLLNGFLESGKTTLIKDICENNPEYQKGTTVIIVCEEGEVEYEQSWCNKYGIAVEYVRKPEDFTVQYFENLDKHYMADRYVVEYNAFFDWEAQEFPTYMAIYQQITLIDASKFKLMFGNMKKIFQVMLKDSSLVVFNRCDGNDELSSYRRQVRAMNQQCQIAFQQDDGSLTTTLDEDLPYDINKDVIQFEEDVYPIWYVEVFDNYQKYFNKTIKFKTFVFDILEDTFVIGRRVMTCCANDIQFLGYEVKNLTNEKVKVGDAIYLECEVHHEFSKSANEEVVILYAKEIHHLADEKDTVIDMNA